MILFLDDSSLLIDFFIFFQSCFVGIELIMIKGIFSGITEGAIPFTLVSPLKLVPINMIGGALASGLGILLGMYDKMPPVGGIYGFFTVGNGWAYLIGLFAGAAFIGFVAPLFVNFNKDEELEAQDTDSIDVEISFEN